MKPGVAGAREGGRLQTHLVHIHPLEGGLQQLEVVKVLVLQLGLKLDLFKTDAAGEKQIHELAVGGSCRGPKAAIREGQPPKQRRGDGNKTRHA